MKCRSLVMFRAQGRILRGLIAIVLVTCTFAGTLLHGLWTDAAGAATSTGLTQTGYVFENDDEDQATGDSFDENTQQAGGNTPLTGVVAGERVNARIQLKNSSVALPATDVGLFYDRNDGIWARVGKGGTAPVTGAGNCADTNFDCYTVDSAGNVGKYATTRFDSAGNPWVAYKVDGTADLKVGKRVPGGGTGCGATTTWTCVSVDTNGGQFGQMAFDANDRPWIVHWNNAGGSPPYDLRVTRYVGTGGTGCLTTEWTCTDIDTTGDVGQYASIGFDDAGKAWVGYYDGTNLDFKVAEYVGTGGTGCASTAWKCTAVDTTGDRGKYTAVVFDQSGNPWFGYRDNDATGVRTARYVGSGGTGCASAAWTCLTVTTAGAVGLNMAVDAAGAPWMAFYEGGSSANQVVANYVGSGGTGCASTAWTCVKIDTANDVGSSSSIAFDPSGTPWISYKDDTNGDLRLARYVGSGGTGCAVTTWTCTALDTSSVDVGDWSSLAFAPDGKAVISYRDETNQDLRVAELKRGGEITIGHSAAAATGDALSESHADMTTATDTANANDIDCIGGGTFNTGRFSEDDSLGGVSLPVGSSTAQCTELAFSLDTRSATPGQTYRFVLATRDNWQKDRGAWRGLSSVTQYPAMTISSTITHRHSKDTNLRMPNCTDTSWGCDIVESANASGQQADIAFDGGGAPWMAYREATTLDLRVARYVGTGGTGCALAAWTCTAVDTTGDVGNYSQIAFDGTGTAWVAYQDATNLDLKVARYVGTGGTGCASTAWTCTVVDSTGDVGLYATFAAGPNGAVWIAYRDTTNSDLKAAQFVGTGGTGCASAAWSCTAVDTFADPAMYPYVTVDPTGTPWISYQVAGSIDLKVARYVGQGGTGCAVAGWTCVTVQTANNVGAYSSIVVDENAVAWVAYYDATGGDLRIAKYVGSGGTGCALTSWDCSTIDSANDVGSNRGSIALDADGRPWVSYHDATALTLKVARFVSSGGTGCALASWSCTTVDSSASVGQQSGIAFDAAGTPWVSYRKTSSSDLKVAKLHTAINKPTFSTGMASNGQSAYRSDGRYALDHGDISRPAALTCDGAAARTGYCGTAAADVHVDSITAQASEQPVFLFSKSSATNTADMMVKWAGRSSVAPSTKAISVEVWRGGSVNAWATVTPATDGCASAAADTGCTITSGVLPNTSELYDFDGSRYWSYFRVVQSEHTTAETLGTDEFAVVPANLPPNTPTTLTQRGNVGGSIAVGAWMRATSVYLGATITDPDNPDTLSLCAELQPIGTAFTNTETSCSTPVAYSGTGIAVEVLVSSLVNHQSYHWQVRTKDNAGVYSGWVSFGANAESEADFKHDRVDPTRGAVYDGTNPGVDVQLNDGSLTSLSVNWSGWSDGGSGIAYYEVDIGTTSGGYDIVSYAMVASGTSYTATGLSLRTGQTYYATVWATDVAGNMTASGRTSSGQRVAPTLTSTVSQSTLDLGRARSGNQWTASTSTNITTSTNGYGGYAVSAYVSAPPTSDFGSTIEDFTGGSYAAPDTWNPGDTGFGYTSSDTDVGGSNRFQSATCPGGSVKAGPGCYAPFSSASPGQVVADNPGAGLGVPIVNETFTLTVRATLTSTVKSGLYNASVVYSTTSVY